MSYKYNNCKCASISQYLHVSSSCFLSCVVHILYCAYCLLLASTRWHFIVKKSLSICFPSMFSKFTHNQPFKICFSVTFCCQCDCCHDLHLRSKNPHRTLENTDLSRKSTGYIWWAYCVYKSKNKSASAFTQEHSRR